MHEGTVEIPGVVTHEVVSKHELKMERDLKEAQKHKRKALVHSSKKHIEEGSPYVRK